MDYGTFYVLHIWLYISQLFRHLANCLRTNLSHRHWHHWKPHHYLPSSSISLFTVMVLWSSWVIGCGESSPVYSFEPSLLLPWKTHHYSLWFSVSGLAASIMKGCWLGASLTSGETSHWCGASRSSWAAFASERMYTWVDGKWNCHALFSWSAFRSIWSRISFTTVSSSFNMSFGTFNEWSSWHYQNINDIECWEAQTCP